MYMKPFYNTKILTVFASLFLWLNGTPPPLLKPLKPLILHFQTKPIMITIYKLCPVIVAIVLWQVDTTDFHIWHLFIELFHANSSLACITEWHIAEKVSLLSNESLIMTHLNIEIAMTYWKKWFYSVFLCNLLETWWFYSVFLCILLETWK